MYGPILPQQSSHVLVYLNKACVVVLDGSHDTLFHQHVNSAQVRHENVNTLYFFSAQIILNPRNP